MPLGEIFKIIKNALPLGDIKDIVDEVVTTKEEKAKLHIELEKLEKDHREHMAFLEAELQKAYLNDIDSARHREIETTKAGSANMVQSILAIVIVTFFLMLCGYAFVHGFGNMDENQAFLFGNIFSLSGGLALTVVAYYFGSSAGSAQKDITIKKLQK